MSRWHGLRGTRWLSVSLMVWGVGVAGCAPTRAVPAAAPPATAPATAELERPIPYPVVPPAGFRQAVENGTRTNTGEPGPNYWQQWTDYNLSATLDAESKRLEGNGQITYHNRSPDTLAVLFMHLLQNLHAPGVIRNEPEEVTGGVELARLVVDGQTLSPVESLEEGPGYAVQGTRLAIRPPRPVLSGDSVSIEVDWAFPVPRSGAGRMGWSEDNLFFLAYWYPQMAVYDDVVGWHPAPYRGTAEFYMGYGNYDITIDAPEGWVVRSTGELLNPDEVFPNPVLDRLGQAAASDDVVPILTAADFGPGSATLQAPGGRLTWHFQADSVRDASFSATLESIWDAARTPVGDRDGDGQADYAVVHALYRASAPLWNEAALYSRHSIDFLSRFLDYSYPYPHMTAVEGAGIIGGGMEFPMMTLIGDYNERGARALYSVIAHEFGHMWLPMVVGTDEKRYAWMDEGSTSFNDDAAQVEFFDDPASHEANRESYLQVARAGLEGEMIRWSDFHYPGPAYGTASYSKPATLLVTLRGLLGEDTFMQGYHSFIDAWAYKHPMPWDFFNRFETAAGRDMDWFWRSWYYETWLLDQAVGDVTPGENGTTITIRDLGNVPMPARVSITRESGETIERTVPVDVWLSGTRTSTVAVPAGSPVVRVEIDAEEVFPDADRTNNVWTEEERSPGQGLPEVPHPGL